MTDPVEECEDAPFLQCEQVYLRRVTPADVRGNYIEWVNDQEITQFLEVGHFPMGTEDIVKYVEKISDDNKTLFLAIFVRDSGEHIGNIKLGPIDWVHRRADIGILIGEREYWGQGIATESIGAVVTHAFETLNLHKLTAGCYEDNVGSRKAFEKVGFSVEGQRPKHAHYDGAYTTLIELGLLREDFDL